MIKTLFSIPITNTILNLDLKELVAFSLETKNKDKGKSFTNIGGWQSNNLKDKPPCIGILEKNIIYNIKILKGILMIDTCTRVVFFQVFFMFNVMKNVPLIFYFLTLLMT